MSCPPPSDKEMARFTTEHCSAHPGDVGELYAQARRAVEREELGLACSIYQGILDQYPGEKAAAEELGEILEGMGQVEEAVRCYLYATRGTAD